MKRFFLFSLSIILSVYMWAQDSNCIDFYGVDFSNVKVAGVSDSEPDYITAFENINNLFTTQAQKYDVKKLLGLPQVNYNFNVVAQNNNAAKNLFAAKPNITNEDIALMVKDYNIQSDNNIGAVLIAIFLDKIHFTGYYRLVFFDIESRRIKSYVDINGFAKGFGPKNFWGRSVLESLKNYKKAAKNIKNEF